MLSTISILKVDVIALEGKGDLLEVIRGKHFDFASEMCFRKCVFGCEEKFSLFSFSKYRAISGCVLFFPASNTVWKRFKFARYTSRMTVL